MTGNEGENNGSGAEEGKTCHGDNEAGEGRNAAFSPHETERKNRRESQRWQSANDHSEISEKTDDPCSSTSLAPARVSPRFVRGRLSHETTLIWPLSFSVRPVDI